jgi:hypothetical protein
VHGVWPDVEYVVQVLQDFWRQVGLTACLLLLLLLVILSLLLPLLLVLLLALLVWVLLPLLLLLMWVWGLVGAVRLLPHPSGSTCCILLVHRWPRGWRDCKGNDKSRGGNIQGLHARSVSCWLCKWLKPQP